ncbi:unnamed protein product [Meloidogyne enterolobii]|uniref:Uncharacterized protein n=1 Tax=Meloidogyne enterolobii TaxID=390850 RepID=A0ACB0XTF8_MELEN
MLRRKKRSRRSNRRLARAIMKALFTDETIKKLDILIGYLVVGFSYLMFIAIPIFAYIIEIHCAVPEFTWFRNLWPFGGQGQNNGGNNGGNQFGQPIQPQIQQPQMRPQIQPPQMRPQLPPQNMIPQPHPQHNLPQPRPPIPWFQHRPQQQASSYADISYTNMPSSSDPLSFYNRSYNPRTGHQSGFQPYVLDDSDESIISDGHSPSPEYSFQDRKRRSVSLMSQNHKGKEKNGEIINSDISNKDASKNRDTKLKKSAKKITKDKTEQQKSDKKFKGFMIKNFEIYYKLVKLLGLFLAHFDKV